MAPWDVEFSPLRFREAVEAFADKVPLTRAELGRLVWSERHRAFWVSHVAKLELVNDVLAEVKKAIANGTTLEEFKRAIGPKLEAEWQGTVANPSARLETIVRTNLQLAYSAGRYDQATDPDVLEDRPYWLFDAILDGRTTEVCARSNGTILPADDPWWRSHMPPCHFNCRSTHITLSAEQAQAMLGQKGYSARAPAALARDGFGRLPDDGERIEAWADETIRGADPALQGIAREKVRDAPRRHAENDDADRAAG